MSLLTIDGYIAQCSRVEENGRRHFIVLDPTAPDTLKPGTRVSEWFSQAEAGDYVTMRYEWNGAGYSWLPSK